jgi:hypothetical protein
MEIAGLAVGLAGLFGLCKDAIEQIDTYKNFGPESRQLSTRFLLNKQIFLLWAENVGINGQGCLKMKDSHHPNLDNPEIASMVEKALLSIREILDATVITSSIRRVATGDDNPLPPLSGFESSSKKLRNLNSSHSKRDKIGWVLGGKNRLAKELDMFGDLVEKLRTLVPVQQAGESDSTLSELTFSKGK